MPKQLGFLVCQRNLEGAKARIDMTTTLTLSAMIEKQA